MLRLPEIDGLDAAGGVVRIPPELDVPMTARVRHVVDTPAFRRLASISQLGLVSLVYPAAHHQRFEHSLGVYRLCLLYLKQLAHDPQFATQVSVPQAETLVLAALLHDLGHWPFCHAIEDMHLAAIPSHESMARRYLCQGELAELIPREWSTDPDQVANVLEPVEATPVDRLLASILSGPIDVDKMDYLMRDSLHAGVPYGRNFDQARLIGSLCLNAAGDGLALTDKGRTAAEMMVFARYVMFSEVYWHHAVRSATAMFQRAFYRLHQGIDLPQLFSLTERPFVDTLMSAANGHATLQQMLNGLFGGRRQLYKRGVEYSFFEHPQAYQRLARQPYARLAELGEQLAEIFSSHLGQSVSPDEVLIDAPPTKLEVQFQVDIVHRKSGQTRPLVDVSPVVRTLAETQFDDYVKRVRIYLAPRVAAHANALPDPASWAELLQ